MNLIKAIQKAMTKKRKPQRKLTRSDFLSTGSTQLNLAFTGRTDGGIPKGYYCLLVGDSSTGKSWFGLSLEAEAANNPAFDGYELLYDNSERGSLPDIPKYFGDKLARRIKPFRGTWDDPRPSDNLEDFYDLATDWVDRGPCVIIEDSMDALIPKDDEKKFDAEKKAREKGKEESGSYGTSKAKQNSAKLRILTNKMARNGSILVIISQTRHTIGFGSQFNPKTRSGGDALRFYCRLEAWLSHMGKRMKFVNGKNRKIGQVTKAKVVKNHINGWEGEVLVPIYRSVGIDEVGGNIDFLVGERVWKGSEKNPDKGKIGTKGFAPKDMDRESLVAYIEENGKEGELRKLVAQTWHRIEDQSQIIRKPRYE